MQSIKQVRYTLGMTQKVFADSLGITIRQLSRLETGVSSLTTVHILAIECLLRRADLFGEEQQQLPGISPTSPNWSLLENYDFKAKNLVVVANFLHPNSPVEYQVWCQHKIPVMYEYINDGNEHQFEGFQYYEIPYPNYRPD